jgi:hypothetical protein
VTSENKANALIDAVSPLPDECRLMLVASDKEMVRGGSADVYRWASRSTGAIVYVLPLCSDRHETGVADNEAAVIGAFAHESRQRRTSAIRTDPKRARFV